MNAKHKLPMPEVARQNEEKYNPYCESVDLSEFYERERAAMESANFGRVYGDDFEERDVIE